MNWHEQNFVLDFEVCENLIWVSQPHKFLNLLVHVIFCEILHSWKSSTSLAPSSYITSFLLSVHHPYILLFIDMHVSYFSYHSEVNLLYFYIALEQLKVSKKHHGFIIGNSPLPIAHSFSGIFYLVSTAMLDLLFSMILLDFIYFSFGILPS